MAKISASDQAIIDAHPDATEHDLLTLHGLSEKGFNLLSAQRTESRVKDANAKRLSPNLSHVLEPILGSAPPPSGSNGTVRLVPKSGGKGTVMARSVAEKMVRMHPNLYKAL